MTRHKDALWSLLAGFLLTTLVMVPPIVQAHADKAARDAAYQREFAL